jgi:hypothetical protein
MVGSAATLRKMLPRIFSIAIAHVASFRRDISITRWVHEIVAVAIPRVIGKNILFLVTPVVDFNKLIPRLMGATVTTVAQVIVPTFFRTLNIVSPGLVAIRRDMTHTMEIVVSTVVAFVRRVGKNLAATSGTVGVAVRQIGILVMVVAGSAGDVTKRIGKGILGVVQVNAILARMYGKVIAATQESVLRINRTIGKILAGIVGSVIQTLLSGKFRDDSKPKKRALLSVRPADADLRLEEIGAATGGMERVNGTVHKEEIGSVLTTAKKTKGVLRRG